MQMELRDLVLALALLAAAGSLGALLWSWRRGGGRETPEAEQLHDRIWRISESEDRYRALVEATMEVVVQRDELGRITFVNEGYARLLGRGPEELIGATVELQVTETGRVETGPDGVRHVEARVLPVDGIPRWFSFVEMPVSRQGGPMQWLRAGFDITARAEAARALDEALTRAEAASVAKSRFLATISHEFRTPLNGILGMADLVLDTPLDAEQRTYVEAVKTSGVALLGIIDGILDFSRIEAGRLDLAAEPFDPGEVAERVVELLAPRAQDKGIEIALDVADDLALSMVGDAERVRQILVNLAGNAIKFTESGGVGVSLVRLPEGVEIAVADTGPGIPPERVSQLFEEFEQGDGSASRSHEGTGLGLSITRRLVERMGGSIEVEARRPHGTVFRVRLPLPVAEGAEDRGTGPALHGQRVLIVADSPFQAPFLARRLSRSGAAPIVVSGEEAGLAALASGAFDALIADRGLGDTAVRRLAEEARRRGARCSLILLSPFDRRAFGTPNAAGFDSYLIKPVRARSLFDRLLAPATPVSAGAGLVPAAAAPGPGARVLLAEDNPINALLASKALERLGATVVLARDGTEALARLDEAESRRLPFDLALLDIRMPGLDGLETARRIRAGQVAGTYRPLRLVALTANAGRDDEAAARQAGFDGFLAKPLDIKRLPALLHPEETVRAA